MRLPSVRVMMVAARQTIARFPFSIGFAVVGSLAALIVVDRDIKADDPWFVLNNVFVASTLGIALCAAGVFAAERTGSGRGRTLAIQALLAVLVVGYGFTLPTDIYSPPHLFGIRHWLLLLAVHLLVAFAPFTRRGETQAFWQFNKALFLRLLIAALYTGVLQLGLSIALAATNHLFELHIAEERYLQLWIVLLGVFNTWFFFSGVPTRLDELETDTSYPRGLKLFTQYVLLPLVVVYLVILYAYVVKIGVTWDWPKGWVANLVLGFSVTGVFSLLLIHPLIHRGEEGWILRFSRWFYIAELPLVMVLLLAIGRRVQEYGMTENRYFVVLMGLWLGVMTVYFLLRRGASIKVIPASLCALAILSSFGPWGAFNVSERSQMRRLEATLTATGILVDGKIKPYTEDVAQETDGTPAEMQVVPDRPAREISDAEVQKISSAVTYLLDVHGTAPLQPWFTERLDTLVAMVKSPYERWERKSPRKLLALMGLRYADGSPGGSVSRVFLARRPAAVDTRGYTLALRGIALSHDGPGMSTRAGDETARVTLAFQRLYLSFWKDSTLVGDYSVMFEECAGRLYADSSAQRGDSVSAEKMMIRENAEGTDLLIVPSRLDLALRRGGYSIRRFEGDIFLGPRHPRTIPADSGETE
jgi:hypothetical protein